MKYFKSFDALFESKQIGVLYHYTNIVSLLKIMESEKLKDTTFNRGYISFSRYGFGITGQGKNYSRIVIDGNKLSNSYKIVPHSRASAFGKFAPFKNFEQKQGEERIYKSEVDISNCILQIDIIKDYADFELSKSEKQFLETKTTVNLVDNFNKY